jgi:hypothetical protein
MNQIPKDLLSDIDAQRTLMIEVATGIKRIQDANDEYKERRERIQNALASVGIDDPNPFTDLWRWYERWSSGDLPTYKSRRLFVADLFDPFVEQLKRGASGLTQSAGFEPTGWARVDRGIEKTRKQLESAQNEEDYQTVGLHCREVLISLGQAVYQSDVHGSAVDVAPSKTDAKRMLEAYISTELAGNSNEEARKHAKVSVDLANALVHRRTAVFRDAALCAEATSSVVNVVAIISGKRDPS